MYTLGAAVNAVELGIRLAAIDFAQFGQVLKQLGRIGTACHVVVLVLECGIDRHGIAVR
jgi:hypothetical protein